MALYYSMLNTTRWQRHNGADFVFYDPHPGFADGSAEQPYHELLCNDFQHAMHIVVERGQRNVCQVTACYACSSHPAVLALFSLARLSCLQTMVRPSRKLFLSFSRCMNLLANTEALRAEAGCGCMLQLAFPAHLLPAGRTYSGWRAGHAPRLVRQGWMRASDLSEAFTDCHHGFQPSVLEAC